jgi:hypothetical protein
MGSEGLRRELGEREQLAAAWRANKSHRIRAELEVKLWALIPRAERDGHPGGKALALSKVLGTTPFEIGIRSLLLNAGYAAVPLWSALDKGMPLATARRIFNEARAGLGKESRPSPEAVLEALAQYERASEVRIPVTTKDGRTMYRRYGGGRRKGSKNTKPRKAKKPKRNLLWPRVREMLITWLETELPDIEEFERERLLGRFAAEFSLLVDSLGAQVRAAKKSGPIGLVTTAVPRRAVEQACIVLSMDAPPRNKPLDLTKAKRQMRNLARLYHPDANGGREDMRENYEEVVTAFKLVEQYNEQLEKEHDTQGPIEDDERIGAQHG